MPATSSFKGRSARSGTWFGPIRSRLLVVREPVGIGESPVIVPWTDHIVDPVVRRETRELLSAMPFINAGLRRGHGACALMGYLREGDRLLKTDLKGVLHWGDQVAMGHYLHHQSGRLARDLRRLELLHHLSRSEGPTGLCRAVESRVSMERRCMSCTATAARSSRG